MWGDYGIKVSNTLNLYRGGPSAYPNPGGPLYSKKYVTPTWDLNSSVGDGSGDFSGYIDGEANDLQPGDWMHYVLRIGDELSSVFINGVKLAESGPSPALHNYFNKTHLYNGVYFIQQFFTASTDTTFNDYVKLDQISIWAGDLTDEDILNLYNDGAGVGCSSEPPPPPVEFSEQFIIHTSLLGSYIGVTADGCITRPEDCKPLSVLSMVSPPISVIEKDEIPLSLLGMATVPLSTLECLIRQ